MFSYHLPDGGLNTNTFINAEGQIKFDPPVYELRYTTAIRIIEDSRWNYHFKKVVDFGCSAMRLLPLLRRIEMIEQILEVDIDEALLQSNYDRAVPLISDYLHKRKNPLRVEILRGSIDSSVENLRNVDAVIGIEIIEHLYANTLENVPHNIFGFMQPKLAIFSTPNSEFNVLFGPLLPNGFRHWDHKFEWNRAEFKAWAMKICQRYTNYRVAIMGVGKPPPDHKNLGFVSQIAIFARKDILGQDLVEPIQTDIPADPNPDVQYKEIYSVDFPFSIDERSKDDKILDEVRYHIQRFRYIENFFNRERRIYQIPLKALQNYTASVGGSEEELQAILKQNKNEVEGDFIIMPEHDDDDESFNRYDDCCDDEYSWYNEAAGEDREHRDDELSACKNNDYVTYESEENWD